MLLRRTCKQVAALLIAQQDRRIALPDQVAVRLHLLACGACPRFERQLLMMRNAMQRWRNYAEEPSEPPNGVI